MARLTIKFGDATDRGGAARVRAEVLDARGVRVWEGAMALSGEQEVHLPDGPAGTYVVGAELPSGERLCAQVEVPEGEVGRAVLRSERPSPWESMDWVYYFKDVSRTGRRSEPDEVVSFAPKLRSLSAALKAELWTRRGPELDEWTNLNEGDRGALGQLELPDDPHLLAGFQTAPGPGLHCLEVTRGRSLSKFVVLPPTNASEMLRIVVALDSIPPTPGDPLNVIVDGPDPAAESLVAYLTRSDLTAARAVGEHYLSATAGRRGEGDAALTDVVAGYYRLLTAPGGDAPDWVASLAERFPWLPEGPALHAGFLVRRKGERPALDRARDLVMESERRGPPCFTLGLRLLFDTFELIRGFEDLRGEAFDAARRRLAARATAADGRATNTTFVGEHPAVPLPYTPGRPGPG